MSWKRPLCQVAMIFVSSHGDVPLAAGFVAPTAAPTLLRLPRWSHPVSSSHAGEPSSSLAGRCRHSSAAAAHTRILRAPNCNYGRRTTTTCTASSPGGGDDTLPAGGDGTVGAGSASSPSAVITAAVAEEGTDQKGGGVGVVGAIPDVALIPLAAGAGAARATGGWGSAEGSLARDVQWEGAEGAAWTEFEDWLVQDTYSRCAVCTGRAIDTTLVAFLMLDVFSARSFRLFPQVKLDDMMGWKTTTMVYGRCGGRLRARSSCVLQTNS